MKHEELLNKWMNDELSVTEKEQLKRSPEYASYLKIAVSASKLCPPEFNEKEIYSRIASKTKK